jgi:hypothetical protein
MFELNKKNTNLLILTFGSIIFLFKWYLSFSNFAEDISSKIIFESVGDGYYYFPDLKLFADFNLNKSFDPFIEGLKNVTIPTGSFFFHFLFYLIFKELSFIILEFFFIIIFIIIFYKISRLLGFERIKSLTIAFVLFNLPILFQLFGIDNIEYMRVLYSNFYSLRFPRPMVSNIFFFIFILFILKVKKENKLNKKNSLIFGCISGFTFTSFYHFFILEQLFIAFALLYIFRLNKIKNIKKNNKNIFLYIISFLIISSPTLLNMFFSEIDFLERSGFTILDLKQKLFLLKYLFFKLFKIQFFVTFLITTLLFIMINVNRNFQVIKILNPLFILFYLSIISPFIFILISPTYFSMGHLFNDIILIITFLLYFFLILLILNFLLKKTLYYKFINYFSFLFLLMCLFANINQTNINYNNNQLNEENLTQRNEFNSIVRIIKKINILKQNDIALLTFDNRFLVWSILNDIEYLNIINGLFISKKNEMIENDLINTFKYLNLNKEDFHTFIKNKKLSYWRYRNENIKNLFWMKYQANSLSTFNGSKNFDKEVLEFINKSSPLMSQQLIMPNDEIDRFIAKFNSETSTPYVNPHIIIINKNNPVLIKSNVDLNSFCKSFEGKFYDFYYSLNLSKKCINK